MHLHLLSINVSLHNSRHHHHHHHHHHHPRAHAQHLCNSTCTLMMICTKHSTMKAHIHTTTRTTVTLSMHLSSVIHLSSVPPPTHLHLYCCINTFKTPSNPYISMPSARIQPP